MRHSSRLNVLRGRNLVVVLTVSAASIVLVARPAEALDPAKAIADYAVRSWRETEGLLTAVTAIAQDTAGYLWVGGENGLFRFDGARFVRRPLPVPRVIALSAGSDGSLWIGLTEGRVFQLVNGQLTAYSLRDTLPFATVTDLLADHSNTIWVATSKGLTRLVDGRWIQLGIEQGLPADRVQSLFEDDEHRLWVGAASGIFRQRAKGDDRFDVQAGPPQVRGFSEDGHGRILVTDPEHVFMPLDTDRSETPPRALKGLGMALQHDRDGNLWAATRGQGLLRINGSRVDRLRRQDGLTSDSIQKLFEDREGNLWVGTARGLDMVAEGSVAKAAGQHQSDTEFVYSITADRDGAVWFGTIDGLDRFDKGEWTRFGARDGLPENLVYATHMDADGRLWVATNTGVGWFASGRFHPIPQPRGATLTRVDSIATDARTVWFCDLGAGLHRWKDGAWQTFEGELNTKGCSIVESDSRGRVWLTISGGVNLFEHERFTTFSAADGLRGPVSAIHEDSAGSVWLGTRRGLQRFENGRFTTFELDELTDMNVASLTDDQDGHLWIGTGSGLIQIHRLEFDRKAADAGYQMKYRIFDKSDGLPGIPVRVCCTSSARTSDGRLWFLTTGGLAVVDPRRLQKESPTPQIVIEGVTVDDQPQSTTPGLELPPLTSKIQIDYTTLALAAAAKTRFRYKLEGLDRDWVEAGTRRAAAYTNLPPGDYRFRVITHSSENGWSDPGAAWAFSVAPTFYQTRWFAAGCVLFVLAGTAAAWNMRLRHVRRQFSAVAAERTRMARELHDTLLQGLVGVALQFDGIAQQMKTAPVVAEDRLRRVRRQVEQFIRDTRKAIWDLRSETLERHDLPAALRETGELLTEGQEVRFNLTVEGTPRRIGMELEQQILRIVAEAISNAVRHASPTDVSANLIYRDDVIRVQVRDNGHGFDVETVRDRSHRGLGLTSMNDRAQQTHGSLTLVSAPGSGTSVQFEVPYVRRT